MGEKKKRALELIREIDADRGAAKLMELEEIVKGMEEKPEPGGLVNNEPPPKEKDWNWGRVS